jgi:hypothetical protein
MLAGCVPAPVVASVAVFANTPGAVGVAATVTSSCCPTASSPMSQWTEFVIPLALHVPLSTVAVPPSRIDAGSGSSSVTPAAGSGPSFLTWKV